MRLPTYEELASVEEQLEVLEWPLDESLFVVGPPGSGKTVLAVRRAEIVSDWEKAKGVVVVTYNRMLRRLLDLLNNSGVNVSTMHSFIGSDHRQRTKGQPVPTLNDPYDFDWQAMLACFHQARVRPSRSHLIVDEGQDLPEGFFSYIARHVALYLTVFADEDQALTQGHTTLEQIKSNAILADPVILHRNHRNSPEVARLAEHFHSGRLPAAEVVRKSSGELPRLFHTVSIDSTASLVSNWRQTRGGTVGVIVYNNLTGEEIHQQLMRLLSGSRVNFYRNEHRNEESTNVLEDGVTVLNKESVKGQEFDAVFVLELERFIPCAHHSEKRAMYMMCSRARDNLFLVYGPDDLSKPAAKALPGVDILERS